MTDAIVYTSNTGFTAQYANILSRKTGLPAYDSESAKEKLEKGTEIIYMGWLCAGKVKGYKAAAEQYSIRAVCGVGCRGTGTQIEDVRKMDGIPESVQVFTLQGGFDMDRLKGVYKIMMKTVRGKIIKSLEENKNRTPGDDACLDMLKNGGNYVREENLYDIIKWYESV